MVLPKKTTVLVIGGGPAGSTAASFLARAGIDVTLLEREVFPRYHIGESLLPSCLEILDLIGARERVESRGFQRKPGAYLEWGSESWSLDFGELRGRHVYSFQVPRAEFDHMLLQHTEEQGAGVFEGTDVRAILFDGDGRPRGAEWVSRDGTTGTIEFDYLIDASGRAGLMSTRYRKNRKFHRVFQNVALWSYWEGVTRLPSPREGAIAVGSIPEGWLWAIPFSDGTTSVGVVMHKSQFTEKKATSSLKDIYADGIASCPLLQRMCSSASQISDVWVEQDYSYAADLFAGPGYFMTGDAACFIDPLLSTGVHLAMLSAMLASASIASMIRGEVEEKAAIAFYEKSYRESYLRFLVFVSAFYDQRRGKDSYFAEAQHLSQYDTNAQSLRQAFLNLVSGLEDVALAEDATDFLIGEVSRRVGENLQIRKDKVALEKDDDLRERAGANADFFDGIEGLSAVSPARAIDGMYVVFEPRLGLARVPTDSPSAATRRPEDSSA